MISVKFISRGAFLRVMWEILMYFAKRGAVRGKVVTSTGIIAKDMSSSQQTVSRKLRELEDNGLLLRRVTNRGTEISFTEKSVELLKEQYKTLKTIFDNNLEVKGIVKSGISEGRYYIALAGYQKQFVKKLGFKPFFGTLNLKIDVLDVKKLFRCREPTHIEGFCSKSRSYGDIECFRIMINDEIEGVAVLPERSSHANDILEVIAAVNLRKYFDLKDNDEVKVVIHG